MLSVGKEENPCNLCKLLTKKPCYPHGRQSLAKVNFSQLTSSQSMLCVFISLHVVVAQVAGRAYLVVHHVLNHHVLITELLDDDLSVLRVGMHATDIVV